MDINIPADGTGVYLDVVTGAHSETMFSPADLHAFVMGGTLLAFDSYFDFPFGNGFMSLNSGGASGVNNIAPSTQVGPAWLAWTQDDISNRSGETASTPEPATSALLIGGGLLLARLRRKTRRG